MRSVVTVSGIFDLFGRGIILDASRNERIDESRQVLFARISDEIRLRSEFRSGCAERL